MDHVGHGLTLVLHVEAGEALKGLARPVQEFVLLRDGLHGGAGALVVFGVVGLPLLLLRLVDKDGKPRDDRRRFAEPTAELKLLLLDVLQNGCQVRGVKRRFPLVRDGAFEDTLMPSCCRSPLGRNRRKARRDACQATWWGPVRILEMPTLML